MEPVVDSRKKNKRFNFKVLLKAFKITIILLTSLAVISLIFSRYTNRIVSKLVERLIELRSEGQYRIRYEGLSYDFLNQELTITNLEFGYDSLIVQDIDYIRENEISLFNATIPYLYIDVFKIWSVYLKKELNIQGIRLHDPSLTIKSYSQQKGIGWQQDAGSLYDLIAGQLQVFEINYLEVNNGYFKFEKDVGNKRSYSIKDISFTINNFLLDEKADANKEKFFYTDDIDLELLNQTFYLKDSIHTLHFKKLLLSTSLAEISVDSLVISERLTIDQSVSHNFDEYNVFVPAFKIQNVDFKKAYNEGILKIGDLEIVEPILKISDRPRLSQRRDTLKNSLSNLALNYFYNIEIDSFQLVNANLAYSYKTKTRSQNFSLDSFSIKLTNFILDSTNLQDNSRPIYYSEIDFSIKDYRFNLPDSIHTLSFNLLEGSTQKRELAFHDLKIMPREDVDIEKLLLKNKKNKTFYLNVPKAEIHRLNGHEFLNSDTLRIDMLGIFDPEIQVTEFKNLKSQKNEKKLDINKLYPLIEGYINAVYLEKLVMERAKVMVLEKDKKLQPTFTSYNLGLNLHNIRIDSGSARLNKLLSAESVEVVADKTIYEDPDKNIIASFDEFSYSTLTRNLNFKKFDFTRESEEDSLADKESILAENILLGGLDLNQFLVQKERNIEYIEINEPVINYHFGKHSFRDTLKSSGSSFDTTLLTVEKLVLNNGEVDFQIENEKFVKARNIYFEVNNFKKSSSDSNDLSMASYSLKAEEFLFEDVKKNDFVQIKSIQYDPNDSVLTTSGIYVQSENKESGTFKISIPNFTVSNWNPLEIYANRKIHPKKVNINEPDIQLILPGKNTAGKPLSTDLSRSLYIVKAQEIVINKGKMNIRKKVKDDSLFISTNRFDLEISEMSFDSSQTSPTFLYSQNVTTGLYDVSISYFNKRDSLNIAKLNGSSKNSFLSIDEMDAIIFDESGEDVHFKLNLSKAYLSNFNFHKLHQRRVEIENLLLYQPEVFLNSKGEKRNITLKDQLYLNNIRLDTAQLKSIKINQVNLNSGLFNIHLHDSIYSKPIRLTNVEAGIDGFNLGDEKNDKILRSNKVRLGFDGFEYHLSDSLNYIKLGRIILSPTDSILTLKNFSLQPKVEKYEYGPLVGDQTDYLNINSDNISFYGIEFHDLIAKKGIRSKAVNVDGLDIYVFRDKRIPRLTEKEKHLPQKYLKDLGIEMKVDTLNITRADITYEEFAEDAVRPGVVNFKELNARLLNICNIREVMHMKPYCFLESEALLMNEGKLEVFIKFDLLNEENSFFIGAKLNKMDLTKFNQMLEPSAFVQIKEGESDILNMSANGNNDVAIGKMVFEYNDLKISFINKNTFENRGMGPVIGSFFANTFIINKNNPRLLMTKEGEIYFERNKYRSVFNYWAKIFFSGIVSSIGAQNNKKDIKKYEKMEEKMEESE